MSGDRFVCPDDHKHDETRTCYARHGCRCDACRARTAGESRAHRRANGAKPRGELAPCGTTAAYRRHERNGEQPCQACRTAHADARRQREQDRRVASITSVAGTPAVHYDGDAIVLACSADEARMIAAAVLDRAIAYERQPVHTRQTAEQRGKADALRDLHKRITTITRSAAA
ncbi:hypothetical protein OVA14_07085 [Agrococcus sp. SL85]|uniref:hypothetical protein n=1 Tax=Agrococcus sp. SL85 TaxID=2995141 RepID=UPI00226CE08E|nr:hypothetical protein [Agrococcus sp. SL85]WAC65157.1 hypothetical protein OVA14_07085 [Agrococcus sp. SL85]